MAMGTDLLHLAETRLGERYVNVLVPKNNPHWRGPWDCAEFASWVVYQKVQQLYGCFNNQGNPALTEAYSGAWARDAANGTLPEVSRAAPLRCKPALSRFYPTPDGFTAALQR